MLPEITLGRFFLLREEGRRIVFFSRQGLWCGQNKTPRRFCREAPHEPRVLCSEVKVSRCRLHRRESANDAGRLGFGHPKLKRHDAVQGGTDRRRVDVRDFGGE
jgi:hypothetical protein